MDSSSARPSDVLKRRIGAKRKVSDTLQRPQSSMQSSGVNRTKGLTTLRRRARTKLHIPDVRSRDTTIAKQQHRQRLRKRVDKKLSQPASAVTLNISLAGDGDFELQLDDLDEHDATASPSRQTATTRVGGPTSDLVVPWSASASSQNNIFYETFNAHSYLHSLFITNKQYPIPIIVVRNAVCSILLCVGVLTRHAMLPTRSDNFIPWWATKLL